MALVTWDSMLPELAPFVPGVPNATMRTALRDASRDFLARSYLWIDEADPETTRPGEPAYELIAPAFIEDVLWVRLDNQLIEKQSRRPPSVDITQTGTPRLFWVTAYETIYLHPVPEDAKTLVAGVVLKPTPNAPGIEDWIYDNNKEAIVDGAIWRLMRIPGKAWSNLMLAQDHKARFDRAIMNANTHSMRSVNLRVRQRPF